MLSAKAMDDLTRDIVTLYADYSDSIIDDIARRIAKLDYATPTAALQVQRLSESGKLYNDILAEISVLTGKSERELRKIFQAAGVRTMEFDDSIYRAAGLKPTGLNLSPAMQETLLAGIAKTGGVVKNLTLTTALSGQDAYLKATDLIYMQVSTGAMSYTQAIREQLKLLAADGVRTVKYAKTTDQIDVAVRRAVLTGVGQTTGQLQMIRARELGVDLVAVSAHNGARPEHQAWQGKVYSLKYPTAKYPGFVESTGYGSGSGLMGWNCRHTFFPFFEGISEEHYTASELRDYANAKVRYNGKDIPFYDATQMQRKMERDVRHLKRQARVMDIAGLDNAPEVAMVRRAQAKLTDFTRQTGLMRQREREGFRTVISSRPSKPAKPILPLKSVDKSLESKLRHNKYTLDEDAGRKKGYFESERVLIEDDGHAIRKPDNDSFGIVGLSRREALASDVDKMLDLGLVPRTVYRPDDAASFQAFADGADVAMKIQRADLDPNEFGKMEFFDRLIANSDRHNGNFMVKDSRLIAIDNGLSFRNLEYAQLDMINDRALKNIHRYTNWSGQLAPLQSAFKKKLQDILADGSYEALLKTKYDGIAILAPDEIEAALQRASEIIANWDLLFVEAV